MDLIFTSTIGTPLNFKNIIERNFKPILKASNVPVIRFHDLRHTAASLMLNNNIPYRSFQTFRSLKGINHSGYIRTPPS